MQAPAVTLALGLPPPGLIAAGLLFLFLPGYAVARLLLPGARYGALDRLLAAPALSLAILALATLWATTLGLPLGAPAAWALMTAAVAGALGGRPRGAWWIPGKSVPWPSGALVALAYGVLFASALALRLWSTRDLLPALGADTYHHTLIARLLVERGGVPDAYAPYAPIATFAYHFGFHALVAWLHWLTGADVGALVGLAGHLVNAAVALGVAFFVRRVTGDELAAVLAAWLVALVSVFPAYLVNWGRFTQAAGLVVLPVAAALGLDAAGWRAAGPPPRPFAQKARGGPHPRPLSQMGEGWGGTVALATAGLFLAHYRMAAVLALLLAVWLGAALLARPRERAGWRQAGALLTAATGAGLLLAPWLGRLAGALTLGLGEQPGAYGAAYYALERLSTAPDQPTTLPLLALAALGLALAGWRLARCQTDAAATAVVLLALWTMAQVALANPYWWPVPMPLAGRVDLVTVLAGLAFPVAVAAAYALARALRAAGRRAPRLTAVAALGLVGGGTLGGAAQLLGLVTPGNALLAPADLAAAEWMRAHTPADARVAVNTVIFPWAPDYVVGVDGGYWLPLLAGRATTVLPMVYAAERGSDPTAVRAMVAVARALRDAPADPATAAVLRAAGVGYVYHSGRPGGVDAAALARNPALRLVYARDGVHVYAVEGP